MNEQILLGDEAIAMGAVHAGISAAYGYPGTPSTEVMEFLQSFSAKNGYPHAAWSCNEKTAVEEAIGVSMVGRRALVTMKHVGLNVAADSFMNAANLKIKGGLVLLVADDPGMHASQNEQDSRFFADFAYVMCFEPRKQQEAYEMTKEAFAISERFNIPVILRIVTRLAHSRALVKFSDIKEAKPLAPKVDRSGWMTLPGMARKRFGELLARQPEFLAYTEESAHNLLVLNPSFTDFGVITTGTACNYYEENVTEFQHQPSHLHIGVYPMPVKKIRELAAHVKKIVVIEEGYSYVERYLRGILPSDKIIIGKEDNVIPRFGELNPDNIRAALGLSVRAGHHAKEFPLPNRPPQLCPGCPHTNTFTMIKDAIKDYPNAIVTSDIGCYSLGAMPPIAVIDSLVCMGASIGMAKGAAEVGAYPVIATIGDSTFLHSGITPLIDCVAANANVTVVIMDNSTVAMTGAQEPIVPSSHLRKLVDGLGIDAKHVREIIPLPKNAAENVKILQEEIAHNGVSVIISLRECLQIKKM
jgi:indolepyruvate ferredoxin oxidoreductase alpha subunit